MLGSVSRSVLVRQGLLPTGGHFSGRERCLGGGWHGQWQVGNAQCRHLQWRLGQLGGGSHVCRPSAVSSWIGVSDPLVAVDLVDIPCGLSRPTPWRCVLSWMETLQCGGAVGASGVRIQDLPWSSGTVPCACSLQDLCVHAHLTVFPPAGSSQACRLPSASDQCWLAAGVGRQQTGDLTQLEARESPWLAEGTERIQVEAVDT